MELVIGIAMIVDSILILVAIFTVISIPGHIEKVRAELTRVGKMLEIMDSNLDAIRTQLVETKNVTTQVRDIQSYKLNMLTQSASLTQNPPNDA